jgi:indolepyruvate ferredoxin oxidoreductase
VAGDDHACKSSTLPHQSEHNFIAASIPVLSPANVQEVLDLGIFGWELSRYSGCWVALKAITENMDSAISADIDPARIQITIPEGFELPAGGVHARWPDKPMEQEERLNRYKIYAAREFARVNGSTAWCSTARRRASASSPRARPTSTSCRPSTTWASRRRGRRDRPARVQGGHALAPRAAGHARLRRRPRGDPRRRGEALDHRGPADGAAVQLPVAARPRVVGEFDEERRDLLPNLGELTPAIVALAIAARIRRFYRSEVMDERIAWIERKEQSLARPAELAERVPHFCSGCPHNTSTRLPEGSHAMGGIGCHYMATWMPDRPTLTFTQMGGEGVTWIGQAPFTIRSTCSRISATAPTSTPASSPCAPPSPRA